MLLVPTIKPAAEKVPRVKDSFYTDFQFGNAFMIMKGDGGELYGYGENSFGQCGYNSEGRSVFAEPALVKPGTGTDELTFGTYSVGMQYTLGIDGMLIPDQRQRRLMGIRQKRLLAIFANFVRQRERESRYVYF